MNVRMQVDVTRFTNSHTLTHSQRRGTVGGTGGTGGGAAVSRDLITEAKAAADAAHAKTIQIQTLREQTLSEGGR